MERSSSIWKNKLNILEDENVTQKIISDASSQLGAVYFNLKIKKNR